MFDLWHKGWQKHKNWKTPLSKLMDENKDVDSLNNLHFEELQKFLNQITIKKKWGWTRNNYELFSKHIRYLNGIQVHIFYVSQ